MGRTLKRVPLDFDHPLNEVWPGYLSPKWRPCPSDDCENGATLAYQWVDKIVNLLMLAGEASVSDRPLHPWLRHVPLAPDRKPGPQAAELSARLAGRQPSLMGHDATDRWSAAKKIIATAGLPEGWGTCPVCDGHGIHPDDLTASEAWEPTEPPTGDGYQLWETTSEGSPVSPVFATIEELCDYAAENCSTFASSRASAEGWRKMLDDDSVAATAVMGDGTTAIFM